jgi:hypothetical protein
MESGLGFGQKEVNVVHQTAQFDISPEALKLEREKAEFEEALREQEKRIQFKEALRIKEERIQAEKGRLFEQ